jgi:phage host-nuclease inhibitor protein Gam
MTNRIRLTRTVVATRAEAEKLLGEIAGDTAALNALKAELDSELTAVRQQFEGRIDHLAKQIEQKSGLLQQWAEGSPEEFAGRKSLDLLHGRVGFRTGNPKLKTLAGWTWERVLGAIREAFVRVKREVDKEGLIAAYAEGKLGDSDLRSIGVRVVQDEAFFIEPKLEEPAGRVVTAGGAS